MNLISGHVIDFDTGANRIRITLGIGEFYLNGGPKRFPHHMDPESLVLEMPLRCAEPFHLGQGLVLADPSLVVHQEEVSVRQGRYNGPDDPPILVTRRVEKFINPTETVREPGMPRPWEKRADTEYALLKTRYEGALSRIEALELEVAGVEQVRATEAREAEERLRVLLALQDKQNAEVIDWSQILTACGANETDDAVAEVHRIVRERNEAVQARDQLVRHNLEILAVCGASDSADPVAEVRRIVRERNEARDQSGEPRSTYGAPGAVPTVVGAPVVIQPEPSVLDAALRGEPFVAVGHRELQGVRDALRAPPGESLVAVAEQRMTRISDLVARIDTYDRNMAEALSGMHPGLDASVAVRKLVQQVRSQKTLEGIPVVTDELKTGVQVKLSSLIQACPVGVYRHRKGGTYIVFAHTINEDTLAPLVHYYSIERSSRWTRTIENFTQTVDGRPRFERIGELRSFRKGA
jgi:hypothetical protein